MHDTRQNTRLFGIPTRIQLFTIQPIQYPTYCYPLHYFELIWTSLNSFEILFFYFLFKNFMSHKKVTTYLPTKYLTSSIVVTIVDYSHNQAIGNIAPNYCNSNINNGQKSYWILQYAISDPHKFYWNIAINAIMQYI